MNSISLVHPLFALRQLQGLNPQELSYQHLAVLFEERTDDIERAIESLDKTANSLEASYESTESPQALGRFSLAKTDLARAYLASGDYEQAAQCGEIALQLSSDNSENELSSEQRRKARLSAHLTVGLAQYFSKELDSALGYFETALEESDGNPDAVCVLAQVLWATGTEEARDRARSALFEVIEKDSTHVTSVLLLGVIALLDDDAESLEAVLAEINTLRTSSKVTDAEQAQIGDVLRAVAALSGGEATEEDPVLTQIQNDIMLNPHLPHAWSKLSQLSSASDNDAGHATAMALQVAQKAIPPKGALGAADLAEAFAGTGTVADAQRAVLVAPWCADGWESLRAGVA